MSLKDHLGNEEYHELRGELFAAAAEVAVTRGFSQPIRHAAMLGALLADDGADITEISNDPATKLALQRLQELYDRDITTAGEARAFMAGIASAAVADGLCGTEEEA